MPKLVEKIENEKLKTGVEGSDYYDDVIITINALEEIEKIRVKNNIPEEFYIRLSVRGGGCKGMTFALSFDADVEDNDRILKGRDFQLLVDNKTVFYAMGIVIDFVYSNESNGFIFVIPNEETQCGCSD